ncbi:MAG: GNAT family N-acetyltransferase [Clostridia bacterium]|nr:GNAT family N-acetyltransferase [Clostridia bacterium]
MEEVRLVRAGISDAETLHRMKHTAFWPLYQRYHDDATSPALELLSKVKAQLEHPATDWYILRRGDSDVGGMRIVRERTEDGLPCCRISPLFVLPEYQGQGLAQAAITAAFSLYPEAAQWRLSTILQEHGNCRLYEKLCFRRTMTEPTAYPGMDIVWYTRLREDVPMRRIARLTDRELLGTEAISHAAPRLTARAIVRGPQGLYAVTHTEGFGIYMLPGGGVDGDESILTALHREVREETGCRIESAVPLGYVEENRGHADYTQLSYYFVVTTQDAELRPELTALEAAHGTTVQWMTLEDMWQSISTPVFERPQGKFLQARDVAALRAYMEEEGLK